MSEPCSVCAADAVNAAGWGAPGAGQDGLAAHLRDFDDPHRTLEKVPGVTLAFVDPASVDGVLPGQRHVNLATKVEFVCADLGSGPAWVQVSSGGWTPAELEARLSGYATLESLAGYVRAEDLPPPPEMSGYVTESGAEGYAADALAEAKRYADGVAAAAVDRAESLAQDVVRTGALAEFARRAELAAYATAEALAALRRMSVVVAGESYAGDGHPASAVLAPYAKLADLAAKASAAAFETLRRASVGVWSESEGLDPSHLPGRRLSDELAAYALKSDLESFVDAGDLADAVRDALLEHRVATESEAETIADNAVVARTASSVDPDDAALLVTGMAVASYLGSAVRTAVADLEFRAITDDVAARILEAGMPGGFLSVPAVEESESVAHLEVVPSTTVSYSVPAGIGTVALSFTDESDSLLYGELSPYGPARDAVVALSLPSGWGPGRFELAGLEAYSAEPDALSIPAGPGLVAFALHEFARGSFMVARHVLARLEAS